MRNYQKTQLKAQLKKQWSILYQTMNQTAFEMGGRPNCYGSIDDDEPRSDCPEFFETMMSKLKVAKICENDAINKGCQPEYKQYGGSHSAICYDMNKENLTSSKTYVLTDGAIIVPNKNGESAFFLDTNGIKGPNKPGFDMFDLFISNDSKNYYFGDYISACHRTDENTGRIPSIHGGSSAYYSQLDRW